MKIQSKYHSILIVILFLLNFHSITGQVLDTKPVNIGFQAGFGLPRVPFSIYHSPVAVFGGLAVNASVGNRIAVQITGNALHTFNFGTVTGSRKKLRFDLTWAGVDLMIDIHRALFNKQLLSVGLGRYSLNQDIDDSVDEIVTNGVNLGIIQWSSRKRGILTVDMRWHLLFNPSPKPQLLTVSVGWFF